jgi:hypothetical protein
MTDMTDAKTVLASINPDCTSGLVSACARCGRSPVLFDCIYDDEFWSQIAPAKYRHMVLCLECVSHYALDNGIKVLPNLRLVYVAAWDGVRPFVPASALAASEARVEALEPYIQEIWFEHRDHDGPGYNECDKPGEECAWCAGTRAALAAAAPPEPPQGVG